MNLGLFIDPLIKGCCPVHLLGFLKPTAASLEIHSEMNLWMNSGIVSSGLLNTFQGVWSRGSGWLLFNPPVWWSRIVDSGSFFPLIEYNTIYNSHHQQARPFARLHIIRPSRHKFWICWPLVFMWNERVSSTSVTSSAVEGILTFSCVFFKETLTQEECLSCSTL